MALLRDAGVELSRQPPEIPKDDDEPVTEVAEDEHLAPDEVWEKKPGANSYKIQKNALSIAIKSIFNTRYFELVY